MADPTQGVRRLSLLCATCGQRPPLHSPTVQVQCLPSVFYCGQACQRADWRAHRAVCRANAGRDDLHIASYLATAQKGGAVALAHGPGGIVVGRIDFDPVPLWSVPEAVAGLARRDTRLLRAACEMVINISLRSDENRAALLRAGAVAGLVTALAAHAAHPRVVESAARALYSLYDPLKQTDAELGGPWVAAPHLLAALTTHAADGHVMEAVASALRCLFRTERHAFSELATRAVPLVVRTLAAQLSSNCKALSSLCLIIADLAVNDDLEVDLVRAGVIPHLVAVLAMHSGIGGGSDTAIAACSAIKNLAFNRAHKSLVGRSGAVPLLLLAMTTHCTDDAVVFAATSAIDSIIRDTSTYAIVLGAGALPVLSAAASLHSPSSLIEDLLRLLIGLLSQRR